MKTIINHPPARASSRWAFSNSIYLIHPAVEHLSQKLGGFFTAHTEQTPTTQSKELKMQQMLVDEQIQMLAKQLKVPTFNSYHEIARQAGESADFGEILLRLMQNEYKKRGPVPRNSEVVTY